MRERDTRGHFFVVVVPFSSSEEEQKVRSLAGVRSVEMRPCGSRSSEQVQKPEAGGIPMELKQNKRP